MYAGEPCNQNDPVVEVICGLTGPPWPVPIASAAPWFTPAWTRPIPWAASPPWPLPPFLRSHFWRIVRVVNASIPCLQDWEMDRLQILGGVRGHRPPWRMPVHWKH